GSRENRVRSKSDAGGDAGVRQLSAILPNGRTVWLRVAEPLASAASLDRLARFSERANDQRRAASAAHVDALDRLSAGLGADTDRLQRAWTKQQRKLVRRLIADNRELEERFEKARNELRSRLARQLRIDRESLRRLRRRGLWDTILLASSLPLFA